MSDLFDETAEAAAAAETATVSEAAPAKRRPGRPRKNKVAAATETAPKRAS